MLDKRSIYVGLTFAHHFTNENDTPDITDVSKERLKNDLKMSYRVLDIFKMSFVLPGTLKR